uniref:Uncharacterized protein n=1 Tax=Anguilla anguilla TaxID=7936 RepID=A0A0E9S398_ANGAN
MFQTRNREKDREIGREGGEQKRGHKILRTFPSSGFVSAGRGKRRGLQSGALFKVCCSHSVFHSFYLFF